MDGAEAFSQLITEFELEQPKATPSQVKEFVKNVNTAKLLTNPTVLEERDVEEIYNRVFMINE